MSTRHLTNAERRLIVASDPDDVTGEEGTGVEVSGSRIRVAQSLERMGFGHLEGPGGALPAMYWNNKKGLAARVGLVSEA